jgi:hypothetical protein
MCPSVSHDRCQMRQHPHLLPLGTSALRAEPFLLLHIAPATRSERLRDLKWRARCSTETRRVDEGRRHNFTNKRTAHSFLCKAVLPRRSLALLLMIAFVFAALHVLPWLIHNFSAKP